MTKDKVNKSMRQNKKAVAFSYGTKKRTKSIGIIFMVMLLAFAFNIQSSKAIQVPETVRIGIHYRASAVSSFKVKASKGIEIGSYLNGKMSVLISFESFEDVVVSKDAYFIKNSSGVFSEYSPTEGIPGTGELHGPYHIKIGGTYNSYTEAKSLAGTYTSKGVTAYVVYTGVWEVWCGFYDTPDKQQADLEVIKGKLGELQFTKIDPSANRLVVRTADTSVLFVYAKNDEYLRIRPKSDNNLYALYLNGKLYRGELEVRRFSDSDLTVINELNFEEYLYGVVPYEMPASFHLEALKAQAVAARTFTLGNLGKYSSLSFNLDNTQASQVYNGIEGEKSSTNIAVQQTAGKKVLYNGRLAQIFYSSASGGKTANVKNVWGSSIPYLISVEDPYEPETNVHRNWTVSLTKEEIKLKLFLKGIEIGDIVSVVAEEYSESGRVTTLKITGTESSSTFHNIDCRNILGVKSQMFTITNAGSGGVSASNVSVLGADGKVQNIALANKAVLSASGKSIFQGSQATFALGANNTKKGLNEAGTGDTFIINGHGYGHGVGMSQFGAEGMAQASFTYDQILKHYFTGVDIE